MMPFITGSYLILVQTHLSLCQAYPWFSSTTSQRVHKALWAFHALTSSYFVHAVSSSISHPSLSTYQVGAHPWASYPCHFHYSLGALILLHITHCREMFCTSLFPLSYNLTDHRYLFFIFLHSKFKAHSICCYEFLMYSYFSTFYKMHTQTAQCWRYWGLMVFFFGPN